MMCLVKILLGKTLLENILLKEKEYTYLLIRTICCLIKNLARKTQWEKTSVKGKRVQRVLYSPWLKYHLIYWWWCLQSPYIVGGIFFFKEKSHISWIWCVTRRTFDLLHGGLLFLHSNICLLHWSSGYYCASTCKIHSVLEIELYADQINILHLHNQSILSWIPRNRINP